MPRRTTRRINPSHSASHAHAANPCRALVPVNGAVIRKKIKKDYEKALRDLDHSRRPLDQFHQKDSPEFSRWMNSQFGALLTELRELNLKMAADEAIVFMVENEVLFGGGSYARAYQRVMDNQEDPEPPPFPPHGGGEDGKEEAFCGRPEFGDSND